MGYEDKTLAQLIDLAGEGARGQGAIAELLVRLITLIESFGGMGLVPNPLRSEKRNDPENEAAFQASRSRILSGEGG